MNIAKMTDQQIHDIVTGYLPLAKACSIIEKCMISVGDNAREGKSFSSQDWARLQLETAQNVMALFVAVS